MKNFIKKIKKFLKKFFLLNKVNKEYINTPAVFKYINSTDSQKIFIIVVAFNEPELILLQWNFMKKFCKDDYEYFVIDNSNESDSAENIFSFCKKNKINYIRLPKNPGYDGSISHGLALNWTYNNLIKIFHPISFGIMDSDFFPTKSFSIKPYLEINNEWGIVTNRRFFKLFTVWYLWVGCAFFKSEKFRNKDPNFVSWITMKLL